MDLYNTSYKTIRRKIMGVHSIRVVSRKKRSKMKKNNIKIEDALIAKNNVIRMSEVINDFIAIENEKYRDFEYNHNPTLGAMYEALTEKSVENMIHESMGLKLVSGHIYDDSGFKSSQIDRMLVKGECRELGFTKLYECHIKDVLVVFEVKKTLVKCELEDACGKLAKISKAYSEYFESQLESGWIPDVKAAAKCFSRITGKSEPEYYSDIHEMSKDDALIFYTIVQGMYAPATILHGYGGYKSENGLREAFLYCIESKGIGVPGFPYLVSSEKYSLTKMTGWPFHAPRFNDGFWPVVSSNRSNPVALIIEIIWTKISHICGMKMPWGDDMDATFAANLLSGKYGCDKESGKEGWQLSSIQLSEKKLKEIERNGEWNPQIFPEEILRIVRQIAIFGCIGRSDSIFVEVASSLNITFLELCDTLIESNLFSISDEGKIDFIGDELYAAHIDDDMCALADDNNRLGFWCKLNVEKPAFENFIRVS